MLILLGRRLVFLLCRLADEDASQRRISPLFESRWHEAVTERHGSLLYMAKLHRHKLDQGLRVYYKMRLLSLVVEQLIAL